MLDLSGKFILVTGSTGYLGSEIVSSLAEMGANVLATGTKEEKLNNLKNKFSNIQIENFNLDVKSNDFLSYGTASKNLYLIMLEKGVVINKWHWRDIPEDWSIYFK